MTEGQAVDRLRLILKGIDECETAPAHYEGWWETSVGADFGARKLAEVEELISEIFADA